MIVHDWNGSAFELKSGGGGHSPSPMRPLRDVLDWQASVRSIVEDPANLRAMAEALVAIGELDAARSTFADEQEVRMATREALSSGALGLVPYRPSLRPVCELPIDDVLEPSEPAPAPAAEPVAEEVQTWFELRLTDELGEPVAGVRLRMSIDNEPRVLTTDGSGTVHVDDATLGFASADFVDVAELRDALLPRWEQIREGDWIRESEHHSYIDCRTPLPSISLSSKSPHTVVVQPRVIYARLQGMLFDTNKAFVLPSALLHIRSMRSLYDERAESELLIVGHTDTSGDPSYNDPLSLERARSVEAFLRDDVDAWLEWYGSGKPAAKRWSSREDNLMLTAVLAASGEPLTDTALRHFQATRGLAVDGIAGPNTRTALIEEYMGFDGTSLPDGVEPVVHGCGESFPLGEDGELDEAPADGDDDAGDRRVELFFFDGGLGVLPPPPAETSSPQSPEYPQWRHRASETTSTTWGRTASPRSGFAMTSATPCPTRPAATRPRD